MTWYKTGTVAVTPGSNAVLGTGTSFIANARVGDAFRGPDGEWYEVINIASNTALSIAPDYQGLAVTAGGYSLAPMQGYVKDSADALRAATKVIASGVADMQEQVAAATEAAQSAGQSKAVATEQADIATAAAVASTDNKNAAQLAAQQSQNSAQASGEAADRSETARDSVIQSEQAAAASAAAAKDSADRAEEVTEGKAASGDNNDITSLLAITTDGFDKLRQGIATMVGATATVAGKKGLVPAAVPGDQDKFLTAGGVYKEAGVGIPVGSIVPWSVSRATIPAGWIARDGQLLNRADWPGLWALVSASSVTDAVWLASPYTSRGRYSSGDGSTTFRMPDTNARHADGNTIAAMVLRGDGKNSAGTPGLHQTDQLQNITGSVVSSSVAMINPTDATGAFVGNAVSVGARPSPVSAAGYTWGFDASRVARTGTETRGSNETVIWCTVGAGKAVNPGSVDVTALATTVSNQSSQIQTLDTSLGFAYVYPNGGSEASPAVVAVSSQYVNPNPFPGHPVICEAQVLQGGEWVSPGWYSNNSYGSGVKASQGADSIRTSTGSNSLLIGYQLGGGSTSLNVGTGISSLPCRVRVWRVKG
jgi:hypothetical protein